MLKYPRIVGVALAISVAATSAACAGPERKYAVPKTLCNISVDEEALAPLLPAGENLEEKKEPLQPPESTCKLSVDKRHLLFISIWQVGEYHDPMDPEESIDFTNRKRMTGLSDGEVGALGDKQAMVTAQCADPKKYILLDISLNESFNKDVSERRQTIDRFTKSFIAKVKQKLNCAT